MPKKRQQRRSGRQPVVYHAGKFPPKELDWNRLVPLIGPAHAALARYDGLLLAVPNSSVLLSPLTTQEAVLSSRIEGTQATMGEVLEYEAGARMVAVDREKEEDIQEVLNYRKAIREAEKGLKKIPLCQRLIKQLHATLLAGARGDDKARGRYKSVQNYIGRPGRSMDEARFIPIPPEDVADGMSRWEKYLHADARDRLVQLAIVHAEFEALHPFLDGNGRMGRMLVPLFLFVHKLLHTPMFYVSEYLEQNRQHYYDGLLAVSRDDDWTGWCEFFLTALTEQAVQNEKKARRILDLYQAEKERVVELTRSQYAIAALDFVFSQPLFNSSDFARVSKIPAPTARRILKLLADDGLLSVSEAASGRRARVYAFPRLLNIAEGKDVF